MGQRLVEVIHLCQDTNNDGDGEDIGRGVAELVVSAQAELQCDTKTFDRHDGDGADRGADADEDHGILLSVDRGNAVDHDDSESRHDSAVE